jgi:hypothetical protein
MSSCWRTGCGHGNQRHHSGPCATCGAKKCPAFVFPPWYGVADPEQRKTLMVEARRNRRKPT